MSDIVPIDRIQRQFYLIREEKVILVREPPTKGMLSEAASARRFQLPGAGRTYPKVQIFTVEDYFAGKPQLEPPQTKLELGI